MADNDKPSDESVCPIVVLIDVLENGDTEKRLNSIQQLTSIALELGEERTRSELIPRLAETISRLIASIHDEDESWLLALAKQLGTFTNLVGGPAHVEELIRTLESLATVEKPVVREQAAESLRTIAAHHTDADLKKYFMPIWRKLTFNDQVHSRILACALIHVCYPRVSREIKAELHENFRRLCEDEDIMVRCAAVSKLGEYVKVVDKNFIYGLIGTLIQLELDDQDSVRSLTVEACISFAQRLQQEDVELFVMPTLRRRFNDSSWNVRLMVAEKICDLQKAVGLDITRKDLVPAFNSLLGDENAGVRAAAKLKNIEFYEFLDHFAILNDSPPESRVSDNTRVLLLWLTFGCCVAIELMRIKVRLYTRAVNGKTQKSREQKRNKVLLLS